MLLWTLSYPDQIDHLLSVLLLSPTPILLTDSYPELPNSVLKAYMPTWYLLAGVMIAVASPGLYVDMGLVKPCPAGHYQPNFTMGYSEVCLPCPTGVTTATSAATAASDCAVALPGYGITTCGSGEACQAETCPVGFYNAGGVGSSSCIRCPYGMTTQNNGSSGEALCLVPPGHGLVLPLPADTSSNRVQPCVFGYNAGWNRAACTSCGVNVTSLNNRTSEADCCE